MRHKHTHDLTIDQNGCSLCWILFVLHLVELRLRVTNSLLDGLSLLSDLYMYVVYIVLIKILMLVVRTIRKMWFWE